ncbi:hypothetical protein NHG22_27465, partial [Streptomyces sp. ATE26]|nr:hypothetical protein [Streptomyces sp. ATE26]
ARAMGITAGDEGIGLRCHDDGSRRTLPAPVDERRPVDNSPTRTGDRRRHRPGRPGRPVPPTSSSANTVQRRASASAPALSSGGTVQRGRTAQRRQPRSAPNIS